MRDHYRIDIQRYDFEDEWDGWNLDYFDNTYDSIDDDDDYKIEIDSSYKDLMDKIRSELLRRYGVPKGGNEACLYVDECSFLNSDDEKKLREKCKRKKKKERKKRNEWEDPNISIREYVESLREEGIELQSKLTLKWDHKIPEEKKLNVRFELFLHDEDLETDMTDKLVVHRYTTYRKLIAKLKCQQKYSEWEGSLYPWYMGRGGNIDSTVFFNSVTAGSKASKMVIFEKEQTLNAFYAQLEEGMVSTRDMGVNDHILTLQYLESAISGEIKFCTLCGNDVPRTLKLKDPKTNIKHSYLNPHAILYFEREVEEKKHKNLCPQCLYFTNLQIDTTDDDGAQTTNQYMLIVTGILLSPAFWIAIALPLSNEAFIFVSIIAMVRVSVIKRYIVCQIDAFYHVILLPFRLSLLSFWDVSFFTETGERVIAE